MFLVVHAPEPEEHKFGHRGVCGFMGNRAIRNAIKEAAYQVWYRPARSC